MAKLPHLYTVKVEGKPEQSLTTSCGDLPTLSVAAPLAFGGPGDQWSPEDLLMASIANCLVLSFRAIAKASNLTWQSISCEAEGKLDRVEKKTLFTEVLISVRLLVPEVESIQKAEELVLKAKETCFISNSLSCQSHIECEVVHV